MKFTEFLALLLLSYNLIWLSFFLWYPFCTGIEKKKSVARSLCFVPCECINPNHVSPKTTVLCHAKLMLAFWSLLMKHATTTKDERKYSPQPCYITPIPKSC